MGKRKLTNKKFLKEYLTTPSPTGKEMLLGGQKVWARRAEELGAKVEIDNYGTAIAYYGNLESDYTVVIDAHGDEIAWTVVEITKAGFLKVIRNGGSDHQIAPSMLVDVWLEEGKSITGQFGHTAIHIHDRPKEIKPKNLFIDIGAKDDKQAKEMGIEVGQSVTYKPNVSFTGPNKNFIVSKALDDKIGGYINLQVLERLVESGEKLPYKLMIVNSVQEEVGLFGANMIANSHKIDLAFTIDVCHEDSSPGYETKRVKAGCGPVLFTAPDNHNNVLSFVKKICDDTQTKYLPQAELAGGTNNARYAYTKGVPSLLLSLPLRYMHTAGEQMYCKDINSTIDLLCHTLVNIKEGQSFKYTY